MPYHPAEDCIYLINQPDDTYINIFFVEMDIACGEIFYSPSDYIELRDGNSGDSPLMGTFCGNAIPSPMQTTNNHMWIRSLALQR